MLRLFICLLVLTCRDSVKADKCQKELAEGVRQTYFRNLLVWKPFWDALPGNIGNVVDGNNKFAFDFLKVYDNIKSERGSEPANFVFSPFSISTAFGLLKVGVNGETKTEMDDAFGWNKLPLEFEHAAVGFFLHAIKWRSTENTYLKMANKIWIDKKLREDVSNDYLKPVKRYYDTTAEYENFGRHYGKEDEEIDVVKRINDFVENETNGRIKHFYSADMISVLTRIILVNAVYFKGTWESQFDKRYTQQMQFHIGKNDMVMVNMMRKEDKFPYLRDHKLRCEVVELVYSCGKFSMLLIRPEAVDGVKKLAEALKPEDIGRWLLALNTTDLQIQVPKLKISQEVELKPVLKALGIRTLFTAEADFSNMVRYSKLKVGQLPHRAFIEVNEEGATGDAVTSINVASRSAVIPPVLSFDQPFMFLILHRETGAIIFVGNIYNPNETGEGP